MAASGYTPLLIYSSSVGGNIPSAGNLINSSGGSELAINITDGKLFYKDNSNVVQVIGWKTVPATAGGTGQTSYAVGDIIYASTTTTLSRLADVAIGNVLISGGVNTAPSWGKVGMTTHVTGVLPIANGGTNASSASITSFNNITGYSASGSTGTTSTNLVFSTSPSITTPVLLGNVSLSTGNIIQGTAAKGVNFTANTATAGSTSRLLNWYEEGTWTPNQGGAITVVGSFISSGTYTRVGRLVTVVGQMAGSTSITAAAGNILCSNLPFTVKDNSAGSFTAIITNGGQIIAVGTSTDVFIATSVSVTSNTIAFSVSYFTT